MFRSLKPNRNKKKKLTPLASPCCSQPALLSGRVFTPDPDQRTTADRVTRSEVADPNPNLF